MRQLLGWRAPSCSAFQPPSTRLVPRTLAGHLRPAAVQQGQASSASAQEHLERSLELGPACKQVVDFEYVAVAFKSQPRRKPKRRSHKAKQNDSVATIFGNSDKEEKGYRSLEVVSGDRRVLFEDGQASSSPQRPAQGQPAQQAGVSAATTRPDVQPSRPPTGSSDGVAVQPRRTADARPRVQASAPTPSPEARPASASSPPPPSVAPAATQPEAAPTFSRPSHYAATPAEPSSSSIPLLTAAGAEPEPPDPATPSPAPPDSPSSPIAPKGHRDKLRVPPIEVAACRLLSVTPRELHRHRGLHAELQALTAANLHHHLDDVRMILHQHFGLSRKHTRQLLFSQPFILRLTPLQLAQRLGELAAVLELQPGSPEFAEAILAAPDVFTSRGTSQSSGAAAGFAEVRATLHRVLRCRDPQRVLAFLRSSPQLLARPAAHLADSMAALQGELALSHQAAVQLAVAEPRLLAASAGQLRSNAALLRSECQLSCEQLAEVVKHLPEMLARPHGMLAGTVRRLKAALLKSSPWQVQLPKLLTSYRNLAVALSFGSERYERLEYLVESGGDRVMGYKDALSLEDEEFAEVFPGYARWRRHHKR